jgi:hypothetical protein
VWRPEQIEQAAPLHEAGRSGRAECGWLKYLKLALHDEVVLSVPKLAAQNVLDDVVEAMSFHWKSPSGLIVPIVAKPAIGH